jgi:adenosylcobinamide kinase/adenosylcobinamide-phosphate guanylyltransferase
MRTLVLGGSRSGKSGYAESLLAAEPAVDYVATAVDRRDDPEWSARIRAHRERRSPTWRTIESGDVAAVLATHGPPVLVDSVTAWLTRAMDECGMWAGGDADALGRRVGALVEAWSGTGRRAVLVTDEVGLGVVPDTPAGRLFRDTLGTVNQRLAARADAVVLVVAGLPLRLR